jgi:hypothetical protein
VAGLAIMASLAIFPPVTPAAAARRIAIGLTALFLLSSATRFGYFIYPISLFWWAVIVDRQEADRRHQSTVDLRLPVSLTIAGGPTGLDLRTVSAPPLSCRGDNRGIRGGAPPPEGGRAAGLGMRFARLGLLPADDYHHVLRVGDRDAGRLARVVVGEAVLCAPGKNSLSPS